MRLQLACKVSHLCLENQALTTEHPGLRVGVVARASSMAVLPVLSFPLLAEGPRFKVVEGQTPESTNVGTGVA